jgi:hypothetical protein
MLAQCGIEQTVDLKEALSTLPNAFDDEEWTWPEPQV